MSNHSAEETSGYLDGFNFKSFFGVSGEPGSFVWNRGQERVPDTWTRRPSTNKYTAADTFGDVGITYAAYPNTLKIGGNTNGVNTFTGVEVSDLSGGVFNAEDLSNGNDLACFSYSILQQGIPSFADVALNALAPVTDLINKVGVHLSHLAAAEQHANQRYYSTGRLSLGL